MMKLTNLISLWMVLSFVEPNGIFALFVANTTLGRNESVHKRDATI